MVNWWQAGSVFLREAQSGAHRLHRWHCASSALSTRLLDPCRPCFFFTKQARKARSIAAPRPSHEEQDLVLAALPYLAVPYRSLCCCSCMHLYSHFPPSTLNATTMMI